MNVLKIFSILVVISVPTYAGFTSSSMYLKRIEIVSIFVKKLEFIKQNVKYENRTVIEILQELKTDEGLQKDFFSKVYKHILNDKDTVESAWDKEIINIDYIKENEKRLIKEFSYYLGNGSVGTQVKGMEYVNDGVKKH